MANDLDTEIFLENDDFVHCVPTRTQANAVTGDIETVSLTGRTDGLAFLSLSALCDGTATAIHASLSKTLTEIGATGKYSAVIEGSDKTAQLAAQIEGATLYRHFSFGSDYHESKAVTLRKQRAAA